MSFKGNIRKILVISLWGLAGGTVLVLLIAAIKARSHKACQGFAIEINGATKGDWFIDKKEIVEKLTLKGKENIKGKRLEDFDLRKMEERLEKDPWIKDVELFFDNNDLLRVKIRERTPVARVFTLMGSSFYIDEEAMRIPLSDKTAGKLPVFTGFPSDKPRLKAADSVLLKDMCAIGMFILNDPFWMAQIEQVDITAQRNFEMIPALGNHVIEFGNGVDHAKKFSKLMRFYKDVLSKAGMNKYARINVQYDKQVIGIKKALAVSKADSLRAVKNLKQLILDAQSMQQLATDSISPVSNSASESTTLPTQLNDQSGATKTGIDPKTPARKNPPYETGKRKPKSVMPKN
jgi:cell division protein FtsQ